VRVAVGDDAALLRVPPGQDLAITVDTLVEGVHFLPEVDPVALGHKSLAVNLSDLAAMGAEPAWVTLALTLPAVDERWVEGFCAGFYALAERFGVEVIGGDTTQGPRSITVQAHGFVPSDAGMLRSAARPGDAIYVTGTLGDAGLGLLFATHRLSAEDLVETDVKALLERLDRPIPRVGAGIALRGLAHACIDVSDGLYADLSHILEESGVGASVDLGALPLSRSLRAVTGNAALAQRLARVLNEGSTAPVADIEALRARLALASGDDYELCFTVPQTAAAKAEAALDACGCSWARIGLIDAEAGLRCRFPDGRQYLPARGGYDHFSESGSA
jgi:thiamine-monophosphate kinase